METWCKILHIQHSVGQLKCMTTKSFRCLSGNGQVELHEVWTEELPCLGLTKPFYIVETYVLQFFSEFLSFNQNVDSASRQRSIRSLCKVWFKETWTTLTLLSYIYEIERTEILSLTLWLKWGSADCIRRIPY